MHSPQVLSYRLLFRFTQKEVDSLFERSRQKVKNSGLDIRIAAKQQNFARLLIIIGKKTGNAPERNLLRRRIKNIFYQKKLYSGLSDGLVIVYKEALRLSFSQLETIICKAFI